MLDLSIKPVRSKYKTHEQLYQFLKAPSITEHKTDGVKLTLIKIDDTGTLNDWIVSYKGHLFYRGEFDYQTKVGKTLSMGNSQFDVVFDHLETLGRTPIEINTEFFIEFLVKKTTVMSDYSQTGQMILIGYGKASPSYRFGKVETGSQQLITRGREKFAKILKINVPPVLHIGQWHPFSKLISGCKEESLRRKFVEASYIHDLEGKPVEYFNEVVRVFLDYESKFGGREEGIVVETPDGLFKVQQDYQLDKEARYNKKLQYMEDDPNQEQAYWDDVLEIAKEIANSIQTQDIKSGLKEIAVKIAALNVQNTHSKKNEFTIRDDIQVNAKNFFLKNLKGNNGALVLGKFRILTRGHCKMIDRAIRECDEVVIGVVTGTRNKNTEDLRVRMIKETYPNIKVVELVSGNVFTAFKKAKININRIYAGSDRVEAYESMLLKAPGIQVEEILRTGEDISATKIIDRIEDRFYFKRNTPRQVWKFYHEAYEAYKDYR